uniref:Uncharacterized protein n=1 Tax=Hucho hucho TaxID=62062 RepID=A0A4W5N740_9TELE
MTFHSLWVVDTVLLVHANLRWYPGSVNHAQCAKSSAWGGSPLRSRYRHLQSGVTPEDSHVYVMYHGTSKQIAVKIQRNGFKLSKDGTLGAGVYLSRDIRKVIKYPIGADDSDRMVLKVKVDVGKVKIIDVQGHDRKYDWHTHGYDTAWVPPGVGMVNSNQEEDCVYDPKRITMLTMLKVSTMKM